MFLENEFYLMNKDDKILKFTCDNSPLGVSFQEGRIIFRNKTIWI